MNYLFLFVGLFIGIVPLSSVEVSEHEFHMSKCEIAFNEEEKALQIILHLFIDDLEAALAEEGITKMYICTDKEHADAEKNMTNYLQENFVLNVNGENVCLLYTSPSPRDRTRSRMPSSA